MKVAVIGGGSTYTPELVDGFARLFPDVRELVLVDPARDRLDVVGPFAARIFGHYGHPGKVTFTDDLDAGLADADVVLIQLRVGGQQARISGRDVPAGLRLRRAGDHRRRRPGQGAADRAGRARRRRPGPAGSRPRGPGSSTSPTRSASSPGPCSTPGTARSGCATSRSASSAGSPACSGWRRRR